LSSQINLPPSFVTKVTTPLECDATCERP